MSDERIHVTRRGHSGIDKLTLEAIGIGILLIFLLECFYIITTMTMGPVLISLDILLSVLVMLGVTFYYIAQRNRMEKELRKSEKKHRDFINLLPQTVFETDEKGNVTFANRHGLEYFGYVQEDIDKGLSAFQLFIPEDRERVKQNIQRRLRGEKFKEQEYTMVRKDGITFSVVIYSAPIIRENRPVGLRGVAVDLTERKRIEKERMKAVGSIVNSMSDPVFVFNLDGKVVFTNRAFSQVFGIEPNGCIGRSIMEMPGIEMQESGEVEKFIPLIEEAIEKGRAGPIELVLVALDGTKMLVSVAGGMIKNAQGDPTHIVAVLRDIIDLKKVEENLRESEKKLDAMLHSITDRMSMMDKDLNIIWANETAKRIFGNDIIGRKCYEVYHRRKEPCEPYPCFALKAFQDGKVHENDTQVVDKDGKTRYFHCTANVALRDDDGKPTAVMEISRDVTEGKKAEELLRTNEENLRDFFDNATDLIQQVSPEGTILYVNKAWCEVLGYTKEEASKLNLRDIIRPNQLSHCMELFSRVMQGETLHNIVTVFVGKDGREINVEGNANARFKDGRFIMTRGIFRNITERKKAEKKLHKTVSDLERFNKLVIDRELQMIELKREINDLLLSTGQKEKYKIPTS